MITKVFFGIQIPDKGSVMSQIDDVLNSEALKQIGAKISFSQFGEDMLMAHFLRHRDGFYVDVGCHDPFRYSNTAWFHLVKGWSGINIDADSESIAKFSIARPNDINVNCGVGDSAGILEFTIFGDGSQNSFDSKMVAAVSERFKVSKKVSIPVLPLRDILSEHMPVGRTIDYMNIDCEGFDEKVIDGNDWKLYAPKFLSIEVPGLRIDRVSENSIVRKLASVGYFFRSQCFLTAIFQRRD
jgi:FkbM family methyltransferase